MRFLLNIYPPYFFTRTRVKYFSSDWKECQVELKKSFLTRNYVGTTFGGSLYAAADPFLMLMLIKILGIKNYIVWDKSARIEFKKPARSTVTYHFRIRDADLKKIHEEIQTKGKSLPEFEVQATDKNGEVCAVIHKTIYIKKKNPS